MSDTFAQFEQRLVSLERKHQELAKGYVAKINPDGLITIEPKKSRTHIRARLLTAIVLGFLVFKAATIVLVGPATYDSRLDEMRAGTGPERFGAILMQEDPVTRTMAGFVLSWMR